jgi:hypothetical protein
MPNKIQAIHNSQQQNGFLTFLLPKIRKNTTNILHALPAKTSTKAGL